MNYPIHAATMVGLQTGKSSEGSAVPDAERRGESLLLGSWRGRLALGGGLGGAHGLSRGLPIRTHQVQFFQFSTIV